MKSKFILSMMVFILCISSVFAVSYTEEFNIDKSTDSSNLEVELLKYDPFPVNPGEYFDLWILVHKSGSGNEDVEFELIPEYPFSLDSNEESVRKFKGVSGESMLLEYKVRVDENAVEGSNVLKFKYRLNNGGQIGKEFSIKVDNAQTKFDGVIQDIEGSSISLALANTGKNVANSVIVKIPEQVGYSAIGTSRQMVGNLDNGDYTIVGFEIKGGKNADAIKFQIDYTDNINERRSVILELPLNLESGISSGEIPEELKAMRASGQRPGQQSSNLMMYVWIVFGFVILVILFKKRRSIKNLFNKNKNQNKKPDWMKNSK